MIHTFPHSFPGRRFTDASEDAINEILPEQVGARLADISSFFLISSLAGLEFIRGWRFV
jgi:hypothetical protein